MMKLRGEGMWYGRYGWVRTRTRDGARRAQAHRAYVDRTGAFFGSVSKACICIFAGQLVVKCLTCMQYRITLFARHLSFSVGSKCLLTVVATNTIGVGPLWVGYEVVGVLATGDGVQALMGRRCSVVRPKMQLSH